MFEHEFRSPVAVDDAPRGSHCEWCGQSAMYQLTVIGGKHHNEQGNFCRACGNEYIRVVAESLNRVIKPKAEVAAI